MYEIVPYTHIDGVPTFTDSDLMSFYDQMKSDGTVDDVFAQGDARNRFEFLDLVKSPGNIFHVVLSPGEKKVFGVFWINRFEMKTARMHFCVFKEFWKLSDELIKVSAEYIYNLSANGFPLFTVLIGVTKSSATHVINYICRNGGSIVGEIPD
jgi:hypothetical protein